MPTVVISISLLIFTCFFLFQKLESIFGGKYIYFLIFKSSAIFLDIKTNLTSNIELIINNALLAGKLARNYKSN